MTFARLAPVDVLPQFRPASWQRAEAMRVRGRIAVRANSEPSIASEVPTARLVPQLGWIASSASPA